MGELTLVRHVECGQEMGHAEERIPLTALENVCQTPKTPMALVIKVMSFNLCCSGRVHYACHVCVLVRHRISVGHLGRFMDVFSLTGLAGGVEAGAIPQVVGKENATPTPQPKHRRMPRAKKVCSVFVVLSRCVLADCFTLLIAMQLDTEAMLSSSRLVLIGCAGGCSAVAPGSPSGC